MVVECEVQVIVMACNDQEAGKHKCEKYWRDEHDEISSEDTGPTSNQPTDTFGKYDVREEHDLTDMKLFTMYP